MAKNLKFTINNRYSMATALVNAIMDHNYEVKKVDGEAPKWTVAVRNNEQGQFTENQFKALAGIAQLYFGMREDAPLRQPLVKLSPQSQKHVQDRLKGQEDLLKAVAIVLQTKPEDISDVAPVVGGKAQPSEREKFYALRDAVITEIYNQIPEVDEEEETDYSVSDGESPAPSAPVEAQPVLSNVKQKTKETEETDDASSVGGTSGHLEINVDPNTIPHAYPDGDLEDSLQSDPQVILLKKQMAKEKEANEQHTQL